MQKGFAIIWILVIGALLLLLFVPLPHRVAEWESVGCAMIVPAQYNCPKPGSVIFRSWLLGRIKSSLPKNLSQSLKSSKPSLVPDPTANWKTYVNTSFSFELKYPPSLNINSLGPNSAQEQFNQGEIISGTVQPSYDTVVFSDKNNSKLFDLGIFHSTEKSISSANYEGGYLYLSGACDLRWLDSKPSLTRTVTINSLNLLEVKFTKTTYLGCYYLKNKANNLIVFSTARLDSQTKLDEVDNIVNQILSTFKFLGQVTPTSGGYEVCAQVITPAKNSQTGECREFPTPCDVLEGWVGVRSCN